MLRAALRPLPRSTVLRTASRPCPVTRLSRNYASEAPKSDLKPASASSPSSKAAPKVDPAPPKPQPPHAPPMPKQRGSGGKFLMTMAVLGVGFGALFGPDWGESAPDWVRIGHAHTHGLISRCRGFFYTLLLLNSNFFRIALSLLFQTPLSLISLESTPS